MTATVIVFYKRLASSVPIASICYFPFRLGRLIRSLRERYKIITSLVYSPLPQILLESPPPPFSNQNQKQQDFPHCCHRINHEMVSGGVHRAKVCSWVCYSGDDDVSNACKDTFAPRTHSNGSNATLFKQHAIR